MNMSTLDLGTEVAGAAKFVKHTDVCIVGGGPAGSVLALQLARLGVDVTLLERSVSYERSFRGESMQPDTVSIFHELGIAETLLKHGYVETRHIEVTERGKVLLSVDYTRMPYRHKYVMDVPQPVLLEALQDQIALHDNCQVLRGTTCIGLIEQGTTVTGVSVRGPEGAGEIHAQVVIGADGRYSKLRTMSQLSYDKQPMNRDVLWFKFPIPDDWSNNMARILLNGPNHLILLPTYPDLFRAGVNIPKNGFSELKKKGIGSFYALIDEIDPALGAHVRLHVSSWADISLLDIFTTSTPKWGRDGLLLIGDAAHTVTPLLGQGVNLAIQDAMALAPLLAKALKTNRVNAKLFAKFQASRQTDIDFVVKLQTRQEKLLCADSVVSQSIRRLNYAVLNRLTFIQRRISDRIAYKRQRLLKQLEA